MVLLGLSFVFYNSCGFDCKSYLDKNFKPSAIDGVILNKQKGQTGCFGTIILKQKSEIDTLTDVCYCVPEEQEFWKYILEGDSLHKSRESLILEVYRKETVKKFQYPCCNQ